MTISLANIHKATATLPPRIVIHGKEGVGKTTFAAKAPNAVFLQCEDGCPAGLEIETFGTLASYDNVVNAISALGREKHDYRTVVLDSIDAIEPFGVEFHLRFSRLEFDRKRCLRQGLR